MKEWITPVLVILGLIIVGFGIRAVIIKQAVNNPSVTSSGTQDGNADDSGDDGGEEKGETGPMEEQKPRIDPEEPEDWEQQHHAFVGFPKEPAPKEEIMVSHPKGRAGHPLDDMVTVEAGDFTMGNAAVLSARPEKRRYLAAFKIDRYEVTNDQYREFIKATGHRQPELRDDWAKEDSWREKTYPKGTADHPVVLVSFSDARAYCKWVGKRLPTEGEWEKAARGSGGNKYSWGNNWDGRKAHTVERFSGPLATEKDWESFINAHEAKEESGTAPVIRAFPVGSYPEDKSGAGAFDMHGNVSEWVEGEFKPYEGGDPKGHSLFGNKDVAVARGNSFGNRDYAAPASVRYPYLKAHRDNTIGFRCAKDL